LTKKTIFRSKFEEEVVKALPQKGCVYEPCKFNVDIPTSYIPDLVLPNGIYVEIKGFLRIESRRKYENFKKQYPELDLRFVFMNLNQRYQGSRRTNQQWAEKHGFIYAHKRVPTSWFGEYQKKKPD
tara:strand:- start:4003 stop:4380 length:378 start_codon:yes stop_codon:yes gene_type:complete